jgi:hypothetical protein
MMTKMTTWTFILLVVISVLACSANETQNPDLQNDTVVPDAQNDVVPADNAVACARAGESYSDVFPEYPKTCCEGLTAWESGMDTRISVADKCITTDLMSGMLVGACIACGDGVCGDKETPCNCPQDCAGKNLSKYKSVAEFCEKAKNIYCHEGLGNDWPGMVELCKQC